MMNKVSALRLTSKASAVLMTLYYYRKEAGITLTREDLINLTGIDNDHINRYLNELTQHKVVIKSKDGRYRDQLTFKTLRKTTAQSGGITSQSGGLPPEQEVTPTTQLGFQMSNTQSNMDEAQTQAMAEIQAPLAGAPASRSIINSQSVSQSVERGRGEPTDRLTDKKENLKETGKILEAVPEKKYIEHQDRFAPYPNNELFSELVEIVGNSNYAAQIFLNYRYEDLQRIVSYIRSGRTTYPVPFLKTSLLELQSIDTRFDGGYSVEVAAEIAQRELATGEDCFWFIRKNGRVGYITRSKIESDLQSQVQAK